VQAERVDELGDLSREELIRIIRELRQQNERLRAEMERLKRKASAAPFSRGVRKKNPRPPGRKKGRGEFRRREAPAGAREQAARVAVQESCCPFCGGPLGESREELVSTTEMAPPSPLVQSFLVESRCCRQCGKTVRGHHPAVAADQHGATAHRLGGRAKAMMQTLHYGLQIPQRKITQLMKELCGLEVTQGTLCQEAQKQAASGVVGAAYRQLRAGVQQAPLVHTDDTGWRIEGSTAQLMAFVTPSSTVYQVRHQHRHQEVCEMIGDQFAGVLICDRGKSYDADPLRDLPQQKCLAHLIRNARDLERQQWGRSRQFPRHLRLLLQQSVALASRRRELSAKRFQRQAAALERKLTHHLRDRLLCNPDNQRLLNGIGAQHDRGQVLRFLRDPRLEATNNRAERALRPAVIRRKVSQCSKSERGARTFEAYFSVLQTLKRQSPVSLSQALFDLLRSPPT